MTSHPPTSPAADASRGHWIRRGVALLAGVIVAGTCLLAASWNAPHGVATGAAFVLERLIFAGWPAALYILASVGAGRLVRPLWSSSDEGPALRLAAGLALMFFLSHLLGWLGAWRAGGQWLALSLLVIPALFALIEGAMHLRGRGWEPRLHSAWLPGFAAVGLALAAACMPPGWLWDSEFGGYDALSYHLMLPQEWLAAGRLAPLPHNVYSFLPEYFEAAFLHLAVAMGAPAKAGGMVLDAGYPVYAAQVLHVGMMLAGAWLIARLARRVGHRCGFDDRAASAMGAIAGAMALATPWTVVTGSLAYNEMAMVVLLAGAMLASWDPSLSPVRRGALVGLLLGAAASVKPTAFVLGFPAVAFLLATCVPIRQWLMLAGAAVALGVVVMSPWLIRNYLVAGNPVFPFAAALFATPSGSCGHWSSEQLSRYSAAHHFAGPLSDRLRLVLFPDPHDPAGIRQRGLLHPQWGIFFPVALASLVAALFSRPAHRAAAALLAALTLQLIAWLWLTHIQSRFLMPLLPLGCVAIALGIASLRARSLRRAAAAGVLFTQAYLLARVFGDQRAGAPVTALTGGVELRTGDLLRTATESERREFLASCHPVAFANLALPPGEGLVLIGGAAPLYFTRPLMYATTWDSSPLADAMAQHPNDPAAWSAAIRHAGATYALVELAELERLRRSGTLDPALEPSRVTAWLEQQTTLIRSWPPAGVYLVRVSAPTAP